MQLITELSVFLNASTRERCFEGIAVWRLADCVLYARGGGRRGSGARVPVTGDQQGDVVRVEEALFELGDVRAAIFSPAAVGDLQSAAVCGRADPRQQHHRGDGPKTSLKPAQRRKLVM